MSSTTTTTAAAPERNEPGPSKLSSSPPTCTICNAQPSKYTCPRCRIKTCSLPCSRTHKTTRGCSGERDRAAYVPMNQYGYSALMNDYVFLEEIGRKVENWGREIAQSGLSLNGMNALEGRARGATPMRTPRRKTDRKSILAMQLSVRDVDMDILPAGMKRANMNSSYWDIKGKRALLSIEFEFQPPPNPLTKQELKPVSIITHKKDWQQTIRRIIRTSIRETKKTREDKALLDWLNLEEDETIPSSVLCLMKKPRSYNDPVELKPNRPSFYKLDWNQPLSRSLRHKHFVDFPTILMADENSFDGVLVEDSGIEEDMRDRRAKRRKLDSGQSKKILSTLVGGYGSDEDDQVQEGQNALESLADYPEDRSEDGLEDDEDDVSQNDEEANGQDASSLEVGSVDDANDKEEDLDWGDNEIAEDEAKLAELSAAIQQRITSR